MSRATQLAPRRVRAAAETFRDAIDESRAQLGTAFAPLHDALDRFVDDVTRAVVPDRNLLTAADAAKRLGISRTTFDDLVRAGRIPFVTLPSAQGTAPLKRWDPDALDRFVDSHS